MRLALVFGAVLALAACQTPCPDMVSAPSTIHFTCADASELVVTFNPQPSYAHIVQEGFAPLDLPSEITGAGYRYTEGGAELVGRFGTGAHWTRPGAAETVCREVH